MSDKQQKMEEEVNQNEVNDEDYAPEEEEGEEEAEIDEEQENQEEEQEEHVSAPYEQINIIPPSPIMEEEQLQNFESPNQVPQTPSQPQVINAVPQPEPQTNNQKEAQMLALINSYQNKVFNLEQKMGNLSSLSTELKERNLEYQTQLSQQVSQKIEAHYKIKQLQAQIQQISLSRDQIKEQNKYFEERLKSYDSQESVEDVKKKLEIAENINNSLTIEIQSLNASLSLLEKNYPAPDLTQLKAFDEERKKVESLYIEIMEAEKKLRQKEEQRKSTHQQLSNSLAHAHQLQADITLKSQTISLLQASISSLQTQNKKLQDSYFKAESNLSKLQSTSYTSPSSYQQQREEIQKDYLSLEQKYYILREQFQSSEKERFKLKESISQVKLSSVPKEQYESLSRRYVQAKKKLESSFNLSNEQQLERITVSEDQPLIDLKKRLVEEESKQAEILKRFQNGFGNSGSSQLEVNELKKEVSKVRIECENYKYSSNHYKQQLEESKILLSESTKKCIQLLGREKEESAKWASIQLQSIEIGNRNLILKTQLDLNEAKVLGMTDTIIELERISFNYKNSYETLKKQLQEVSLLIGAKGPVISNPQHQTQPQITFKIVQIPSQTPMISQSTQTPSTENVSKLKKINQALKLFPEKLHKLLVQIEDVNKQGMELNQRYNMRFKTLNAEKMDNDNWRSKTRDEILVIVRKEFNEIKEIIEDDRLLNALQKAKYLIDEYSKEYDEGQANAVQEPNQQPQEPQEPQQPQEPQELQEENPNPDGNNQDQDPTLAL